MTDLNWITDEEVGRVSPVPGLDARFRIGWESGDVFDEDDVFDGYTLTIEVADKNQAQAFLAAIQRMTSERVLPAGDYHEGIEEGWKAGAQQEARIWQQAVRLAFGHMPADLTRRLDEVRAGVEGE